MKVEETLFRTVVDVPKWTNPMQKGQHFVLLGSCFAQNIGEHFQSYGLDAVCNPLGVTYNPESIAIQVRQALGDASQTPLEETFFAVSSPSTGASESLSWRSWLANTLISDTNKGRLQETVRSTFSRLGEALRRADYVFITFGTNVCYRLKESGLTVANCHKQPDALFEEVTLDAACCSNLTCQLVELVTSNCPTTHVIFTVSPYRYKKYGFHGSQLAKATLLLAIDEACKRYPEKASYFPAYEILLDELRDYRFYADDMIHPSPAAVDYIWRRMVDSCMSDEMQQYLKDYEPIRRAKMHRANK